MTTNKTRDWFKRFTNIWRERWTSKFVDDKDDLLGEWKEALKNFSAEQIDSAISMARNKYAWPPSISEFLELCKANGSSFVTIVDNKSPPPRLDEIGILMSKRDEIHKLIKKIYFKEILWIDCHLNVGKKFLELEKSIRGAYPNSPELEIYRIMKEELEQDLKETY